MPKYSQVLANVGCDNQRKQVKVCLSNVCPAVSFPHTGGVSWAVGCHEWSSWQTPVPRPPPWSLSLRLCSLNWEEAVVSSWSWPPGESNKTDRDYSKNPIGGLLLSCKQTVLHVMCAMTTGLSLTLSKPHTNHQRKLPSLCSIIQKR